jgi:hypothetical protein
VNPFLFGSFVSSSLHRTPLPHRLPLFSLSPPAFPSLPRSIIPGTPGTGGWCGTLTSLPTRQGGHPPNRRHRVDRRDYR